MALSSAEAEYMAASDATIRPQISKGVGLAESTPYLPTLTLTIHLLNKIHVEAQQ